MPLRTVTSLRSHGRWTESQDVRVALWYFCPLSTLIRRRPGVTGVEACVRLTEEENIRDSMGEEMDLRRERDRSSCWGEPWVLVLRSFSVLSLFKVP